MHCRQVAIGKSVHGLRASVVDLTEEELLYFVVYHVPEVRRVEVVLGDASLRPPLVYCLHRQDPTIWQDLALSQYV